MQGRHGPLAQLGGRGKFEERGCVGPLGSDSQQSGPAGDPGGDCGGPQVGQYIPTLPNGQQGGAGIAPLRYQTCRQLRRRRRPADNGALGPTRGTCMSGCACGARRQRPRSSAGRRRAGGPRRVLSRGRRWWHPVRVGSHAKGASRSPRLRCAARRRQERPDSCLRGARGVRPSRQLRGRRARRNAPRAAHGWRARPTSHRRCGGRRAGRAHRGSCICAVRAGGGVASAAAEGHGTAHWGWPRHRGWAER